MLEFLHLKYVGPAPEMEMHLAPRLNLITGDNGLGKTFLMEIAWWVLTKNWNGMPIPPQKSQNNSAEIAYRGRFKGQMFEDMDREEFDNGFAKFKDNKWKYGLNPSFP
jgi:recombinational DNA repair ATPase RecF